MRYTTCTFLILICSIISHGQTQTITSIAGNGSSTFSGDGGPATAAGLSEVGICRDIAGNFYISDSTNARVRKISSSGIITTVAGNGTHGYSGDGGPATNASLYPVIPSGLAIDATGNLYIADSYNGRIRKVNTSGIISTIVGGGTGYTDGIPATSFALYGANGVCIDPVGNIYVSSGLQVMKVTTSGLIYTFAGDGISGYSGDGGQATAARLAGANGLSMDASGNIYIADAGNYCIRKVNSSGVITTFAGNGTWGYSGDGGPATAAQMNMPYAIAFDGSSNSYIANSTVIRKVNSAGIISTIAGGGGSFADGVAATATNMAPIDVCTDPSSNIYLCDLWNHRIRKICGTLISSGAIHGDSILCSGATLTLTDSVSGGVWSSSDTTVATITSGGIVIADTVLSATTVTIKYTVSNACGSVYSTKHVTVNPLPFVPPITIPGASSFCIGSVIFIDETISGGIWSSSNTAVATVGSTGTSSHVTGISAGIDTITFTLTNSLGCSANATKTVTINPTPSPGVITGSSAVCAGSTISLADTASGGMWSSSNTSVATVGSTGTIAGVMIGSVNISYTVANSSCSASVVKTVTVNPLPNAGIIVGSDSVCVSDTISLTDILSGGIWSASNGNAFVSSLGVVLGAVAGSDTIYYSVTNSCGTANAPLSIAVTDCAVGLRNVKLPVYNIVISPNPTQNSITITASAPINDVVIFNSIGQKVFSGRYNTNMVSITFGQLPDGVYVIKINDSKVYKVIKQ